MAVLSKDGKLISGDIVNFLGIDESEYPQLTRLYIEFDFRVIEVSKIDGIALPTSQFIVTFRNRCAEDRAVTPLFDSLDELERHTDENVVDILQKTVFEATLIAMD